MTPPLAHNDVYLGRKERLGDLTLRNAGKVRDIYTVDDERLLFVTSDRVSAFDVIFDRGIPDKGRVLTHIAAHWFEQTKDLIPNHLLSTDVDDVPGLDAESREDLRGRIMLVQRCDPTAVEWVVRGYIAGSGWKEYVKQGTVCDIPLPEGLEFCGALPEPLLTPTTKDDEHDEAISPERAAEIVGPEVFATCRDTSLALFARGTEQLAAKGILLADTKFEFGLRGGEVVLIDEALTPDSSRFWPADQYATGKNQPSYDKQILRDWLEDTDWNKQPPPPPIPDDIVERVSARYLEAAELVTGSRPMEVTR
jgi:phosphoribosylaminoimidazole-succinocarboxamide synthase